MSLKRGEEQLVTSLYYAYCDSFSGTFTPGSDKYELRGGKEYYTEKVNGFEF